MEQWTPPPIDWSGRLTGTASWTRMYRPDKLEFKGLDQVRPRPPPGAREVPYFDRVFLSSCGSSRGRNAAPPCGSS